MTDLRSDIRNIAKEGRPIIARMMDDAEILAGLGKVCREKGIDWAQLKALLKAQIRDDRDESGDNGHVNKIIDRADAASAYADMLANMNNESFSFAPSAEPPTKPAPSPIAAETRADAIEPVTATALQIPDDGSIPPFLRRNDQHEATQ
jgi:hypothetical protein